MITLQEHIETLQKLAKENPKLKSLPIVYSRDDEGNGFQKVVYQPGVGHIDERGEFDSVSDCNETDKKVNCVCIN